MSPQLERFYQVVTGPGERQQNEPGHNGPNNCGPAVLAVLGMMIGFADIEPQDLVGAGYVGGTTAEQLKAIMESHYKGVVMAIDRSPANPWKRLTDYLNPGHQAPIARFNCDDAGHLVTTPTGITHFCLVLDNDATSLTYWNPDWGIEYRDPAFIAAASVRELVVATYTFDALPASAKPAPASPLASAPPVDPCAQVKTDLAAAQQELSGTTARLTAIKAKAQEILNA